MNELTGPIVVVTTIRCLTPIDWLKFRVQHRSAAKRIRSEVTGLVANYEFFDRRNRTFSSISFWPSRSAMLGMGESQTHVRMARTQLKSTNIVHNAVYEYVSHWREAAVTPLQKGDSNV
jgi:hypothetical protein